MTERKSLNDRLAERIKAEGIVPLEYNEPSAYDKAFETAKTAAGSALQFANSTLDSATAGVYGYGVNLLGGAVEAARSTLMDETPVGFGEAYRRIQSSRQKTRDRYKTAAVVGDITGAVVGGGKVAKALEAVAPVLTASSGLGSASRVVAAGIGGGISEGNKAGNLGQDVTTAAKLGAAGGVAGQAAIGEALIPLARGAYKYGLPAARSMLGGPYAQVGDATWGQRLMRDASDASAARSLAPGGIFAKAFDSSEGISRESLMDMAQKTVPGEKIMADMDPRLSAYAATLAARPASAGSTQILDDIASKRLETVDDRAGWFITNFFSPDKSIAKSLEDYSTLRKANSELIAEAIDTAPNQYSKKEVIDIIDDAFDGPLGRAPAAQLETIKKYLDSDALKPITAGNNEKYFSARGLYELKKSVDYDLTATDSFGKKALDNDTQRRLMRLSKQLGEKLSSVDGFEEATSKFADDATAEAARRLAKEHMKTPLDKLSNSEMLKKYNGLSASAKTEYMLGLSQYIGEAVEEKGAEAFIKKLAKKGATRERARLTAILGEEAFEKMHTGALEIMEAAERAKSWKRALERREQYDEPAKGLFTMLDQASIASTIGTGQLFSTRAMVPARRLIRDQDQVAIASLLELVQSSGDDAVNAVSRITKDRRYTPPIEAGAVGSSILDEALRPQ